MRAMDGERILILPKTFFFTTGHHWRIHYGAGWWKKKYFGSIKNRSPSIARMVWDIGTSVYSSPKAFRSFQSDDFDVLSAMAASAEPPGGHL